VTIHISRERYDRIRNQCYGRKTFTDISDLPQAVPKAEGDDVEFHLLAGERAFCDACGVEVESVKAETPMDIQRIKHGLAVGAN
jgi:hypothetical protein